MITTEHMGLVLWDREKDLYEHSKLADNFVKIDQHNHAGLVLHGEYENGDLESPPVVETPTPKTEIINYAEDNADVAKWEAVGLGEAIRTPEAISPTVTAIKPESIWRYLLARRSVGHNQLDLESVWTENIADEAVTTSKIADDAVTTPKIKDENVTGKKLEKGLIPLGIVVAWYKSPAESSPGAKWRVCNGQVFGTNDMGIGAEEKVPDLRDKFIRGTEATGSGTTGGRKEVNFAHTHSINSHSHTVNGHSHGINDAPGHNHGFNVSNEEGEGYTPEIHLVRKSETGDPTTTAMRIPALEGPTVLYMTTKGKHNHGGSTNSDSPGTNGVPLATNNSLGLTNIEPPWYGLCYIMKVRT